MPVYERRCVVCGFPESEVGQLSRRGLCEACGVALVNLNAVQMRDREGPFYEHWARQRYLASLRTVVALEREREPADLDTTRETT